MQKAVRGLIEQGRLRDWWMFGTGWLWLARVLKVAGAVNFIFFVWMFLSNSLSWLFFFFMALTAFSVSAIAKRRSGPAHVARGTPGLVGEGTNPVGAGAIRAATPQPAPMFDREGRTPLERAMRDEEEGK
ncbi:MAG: hypothetical protein QOJ76_275 [Acidobacteriota bacterium]|jgi:hypothetical protein|nr:hypothetical protein [Acidobacteriota bacterium]